MTHSMLTDPLSRFGEDEKAKFFTDKVIKSVTDKVIKSEPRFTGGPIPRGVRHLQAHEFGGREADCFGIFSAAVRFGQIWS
jgi:hypothetical protein